MNGTTDFAIDLLLGGFASSVALVLFADAPVRRALMAFGLACAVGILAISILGPVRTGFLLAILYFFYGHFREKRGRAAPAPVPAPDRGVVRPRGSFRRRPGWPGR